MVPPLGGRRRVLTPSLRVTDSRIQNLVLRRLVLFLWFSIVFQNNYGGDSQISFKPVFFFFRFAFPSRFRLRHPDMKEILFDDFKASYYNLLSLYYIYLSLILINLYWCRISTDLHQIMIVAWQERFGI